MDRTAHAATDLCRRPASLDEKLTAVNADKRESIGKVVSTSHLLPRDSIHQYAGSVDKKFVRSRPQLNHTGSREIEL